MLKYSFISLLLLALFSCGGGSSSSSNNEKNNEITNFEFSKELVVDIVNISTLLSEGPVATVDLLESELLWFYHSPVGVNRRDCKEGGKVIFNNLVVDENSMTGTLDFQNCKRKLGDYLTLSGKVSVDFSMNSKEDFTPKDYQTSNALSSFKYSIVASEFFVGLELDEMSKINFNISSSVNSNWQDSPQYGGSKFVSKKTRDINVNNFSLEVYDELTSKLKKESIVNATYYQQQEVGDEEETYSLTLSGTYNSQLVNKSWSVKGSLNRSGENYDYDYDKSLAHNKLVDGNFELTLDNKTIVAKINIDSHTEFYLNDELVAQDNSLGYEGDILFIGWDQQMFDSLHNDTPLTLISATPNSQIDSLEQNNEVSLVFNKILLNGSIGILDSSLNKRIDYAVQDNVISAMFSTDDVKGDLIAFTYNASSSGTSYIHRIFNGYHYVSIGEKHIYKLPQETHGLFQDENSKDIFGYSYANKSVYNINSSSSKVLDINAYTTMQDYCSIGSKFFVLERGSGYSLFEFDIENNFTLVKNHLVPDVGYMSTEELGCNENGIVFYGGNKAVKFNINNGSFAQFANKELGESVAFKRGMISTLDPALVYYVNNRGDIGYYDLDNAPNTAITEILPPEKTKIFYNRPILPTSLIENVDLGILASFHLVIDANSPQVIMHEFDNGEESGRNEEIKIVDSLRNVIVTTKGIYRATDYQLIKELPSLNYPKSFLIDADNVLHVLMHGGEYIYTTTLN